MGSMISLGVGKMEIDWGKNNMFRDHSALFTDGDIKDIPYYYAGLEENEIITEYHEGFSRKFFRMVSSRILSRVVYPQTGQRMNSVFSILFTPNCDHSFSYPDISV